MRVNSPTIEDIEEVRLIGVDTPETKEPGCEVQPYGPEASEFATHELQGEEVQLEFDEEREDRYDRLLACVYKDGDMFYETLLEEGYAQVYIVDPNDKYEDRFEETQSGAQAAELGIWGLSASEQVHHGSAVQYVLAVTRQDRQEHLLLFAEVAAHTPPKARNSLRCGSGAG